MKNDLSKFSAAMYWLILAAVAVALVWAYFMPQEIIVAAAGQIHYLGEPQAVSAIADGTAESPQVKSFDHVDEGATLIHIVSDRGRTYALSAPGGGAAIWTRSLIKGDRVQENERIAVIYPDDTMGMLIHLSDRDVRKIDVGMQVRIRLDAYPFQDYGAVYGTVYDITPELGAGGRIETYVLVSLDDVSPAITLRPGLSASADIIVGHTTLLRRLLR